MTADIVLTDNAIEFIDAEKVTMAHNGRSIEVDLQPNARMQIGTDEHRGLVVIRGRGARLYVSDGMVKADDLVAKDQVRIGSTGEGGTFPGRLTVQGRNGVIFAVDGNTGEIDVAGVGNLAQRMAELTALRAQVAQMEQRLRALESGSS